MGWKDGDEFNGEIHCRGTNTCNLTLRIKHLAAIIF